MAARVCESEQNFLRLQQVIGNVEQMENVTNDVFNDVSGTKLSIIRFIFLLFWDHVISLHIPDRFNAVFFFIFLIPTIISKYADDRTGRWKGKARRYTTGTISTIRKRVLQPCPIERRWYIIFFLVKYNGSI